MVNEGGAFDMPPTEFFRLRENGTITVDFTACDEGMVSYQIEDPPLSNRFPIVPLEKVVDPVGFSCGPP